MIQFAAKKTWPLLALLPLLAGCISTPERGDPLTGLGAGADGPLKNLRVSVVYSENTRTSVDYLRKSLRSYDPGPQLLSETDDFFRKLFRSEAKVDRLDAALGTDLVVVLDANVQTATFLTQKYTIFADIRLIFLSPDGKEIERLDGRDETSMWAHLTENQPVIDVWHGAMHQLGEQMTSSVKLSDYAKARSAGSVAAASGLSRDEILRLMKQAVMEAGGAKAPARQITSDVDAPDYSRPEDADSFAVVFGVEKYRNLPAAVFADRDAAAVRAHLLALGVPQRNIFFAQDQDATRAGMVKAVHTWLPARVSEKSTVFFYYSGHGAPDLESREAYLVPIDGDPEALADTAYPLKSLYRGLGQLKAKQVIVALDSCFSGAGGRSVLPAGTRPLVTKVALPAMGSGDLITFSASKGDQISGTIDDQGHGAFTYYFLKGLNGAAAVDGGAVTVRSLYDYLGPKVADAARAHNRDQNPELILGPQADAGMRLR